MFYKYMSFKSSPVHVLQSESMFYKSNPIQSIFCKSNPVNILQIQSSPCTLQYTVE